MTSLTVLKLAQELQNSGWDKPWKTLLLAARFYKGLETTETLKLANLKNSEINHILYMR